MSSLQDETEAMLERGLSESPIWNRPNVLDHSCVRCGSQCLRLCFYRWGLCLREAVHHPSLTYGTAFHHACGILMSNGELPLAQSEFRVIYQQPESESLRTYELADELLRRFLAWWARSNYTLVSLGDRPMVEVGFAASYGPSLSVVGRIDGIIHDQQFNCTRLLELKSASRISGSYWHRYRIDTQLSCYITGARQALGDDTLSTALVRVLFVSPSIFGRTVYAGTKREAHRDGEQAILGNIYERTPTELVQHQRDFLHHASLIQECIKRSSRFVSVAAKATCWPRTTAACINEYQQVCPFMDACEHGLLIGVTPQDFVVERWSSWEGQEP